ncbi:MAG: thioesterase family protein [Alphaproteobacteria bacterium]|nr:thioesterase family protein [Alphaproteobacteria bacterium]MCB9792779.1 thioesterase family protein [Alphaproteobacteria bacterium]
MPSFREALNWEPDGDASVGVVTEDQGQGRAAFGGLVTAVALRAMGRHAGEGRVPRSVMTSFVGPLGPGPARADVEVLRQGRSLSHLRARVSQEGQTCAEVLAAFGATRPSLLQRPGPPPPPAPPPESLPAMPYLEGVTPAFTQHWDIRWASPDLPFSGGTAAYILGWVRCRDGGPVDAAVLVAMMDAWPAPVWTTIDRPMPGSSATWQANLVRDLPPGGADPEAFWLYEARTVVTEGGYSDFEARLWDAEGRLAASSRQLFAEFSVRG